MKTKEEIKKEAEERFWEWNGTDPIDNEITQLEKTKCVSFYLSGYNKCQEDNSGESKNFGLWLGKHMRIGPLAIDSLFDEFRSEQEEFVTYDIAYKLKEKGFDVICFGKYDNNKVLRTDKKYVFENDEFVLAPLWQQVIDWFRKKHNKIIEISLYYKDSKDSWTYEITEYGAHKTYSRISKYKTFKNYYEAFNPAIEEALKLI